MLAGDKLTGALACARPGRTMGKRARTICWPCVGCVPAGPAGAIPSRDDLAAPMRSLTWDFSMRCHRLRAWSRVMHGHTFRLYAEDFPHSYHQPVGNKQPT